MSGLAGCGTALVTPFTANGAVDEPALRALVEWQIESGIDFLVPCGSTGEAQTLSAGGTGAGRLPCRRDRRRPRSRHGRRLPQRHSPGDRRSPPDEWPRRAVAARRDTVLQQADARWALPALRRRRRRFGGAHLSLQRAGPDGGESQTGNRPAARPARERGGDQGIERRPGPGPAHPRGTFGRFCGPVRRRLDDARHHGRRRRWAHFGGIERDPASHAGHGAHGGAGQPRRGARSCSTGCFPCSRPTSSKPIPPR